MCYSALKVILLFVAIIVVVPLVFFTLVALIGKYFSLTIDSNSWVARSDKKIIKFIFKRFMG